MNDDKYMFYTKPAKRLTEEDFDLDMMIAKIDETNEIIFKNDINDTPTDILDVAFSKILEQLIRTVKKPNLCSS